MYKKHPVSKGIFTIWIGAGFCPSTVLSFPEKNSYIIKRPESRWVFRLQNDWTIPYKIYKLEDDQHDDLCICRYFTGELWLERWLVMEPRSTLGISGCLFTSQVGTGHHCLSWQLHTPYPSKTMARPDTISKLHLFAATCKESYLKPSQTLKCFKLWCWVHPHSSFILHSSLRIKICTSKTPLFLLQSFAGIAWRLTVAPCALIASSRWTLKFQEKVPTKISADCKSRKSSFEDRKLGQDVSTY